MHTLGSAQDAAAAAPPWWPPVVIALAALAFSLGSFWWLHARRGRLTCYVPHSFAAFISPDILLIRLPLALFNSGAVPLVVQDMRLRFPMSRMRLSAFLGAPRDVD